MNKVSFHFDGQKLKTISDTFEMGFLSVSNVWHEPKKRLGHFHFFKQHLLVDQIIVK